MAALGEITVRPVVAADRDDWLLLWREWQDHMKCRVPQDVTASTWARFLDPRTPLHGMIARDAAGTAQGLATLSLTPFAWTASDIAFLQDLYVAVSARGHGIGAALLRGVYRLADELSATQVFWMVDEADPPLQRFYDRHAIRTPYLRYMRHPWPW